MTQFINQIYHILLFCETEKLLVKLLCSLLLIIITCEEAGFWTPADATRVLLNHRRHMTLFVQAPDQGICVLVTECN